jgi:hypothetical protein
VVRIADYAEAVVVGRLAPGVDLDINLFGQFAGKIFHVYAGTTVNIGRVFASHQAYTH